MARIHSYLNSHADVSRLATDNGALFEDLQRNSTRRSASHLTVVFDKLNGDAFIRSSTRQIAPPRRNRWHNATVNGISAASLTVSSSQDVGRRSPMSCFATRPGGAFLSAFCLLLLLRMSEGQQQPLDNGLQSEVNCNSGEVYCESELRCVPRNSACDAWRESLQDVVPSPADRKRGGDDDDDNDVTGNSNTMIVILVSVIGGVVVINLILLIICVFKRLDSRRASRTPPSGATTPSGTAPTPSDDLESGGGRGGVGGGVAGSRPQRGAPRGSSAPRRDNNNAGESQSVAPSIYTNGSLSELHTYPYPSLESIRTNSLRSGGNPPTYSDVFPWIALGTNTLDGSSLNTLSYNTIDRTLGGSISPDEKPPEYLELCGEITEAFLTSHPIERSRSESDLRCSPVRTPPLDNFHNNGEVRRTDDNGNDNHNNNYVGDVNDNGPA